MKSREVCFSMFKIGLIGKLEAYGIGGSLLSWISSFLMGRSQKVSVNGSLSSSKSVLSGIPQGSVLGPELVEWKLWNVCFSMFKLVEWKPRMRVLVCLNG